MVQGVAVLVGVSDGIGRGVCVAGTGSTVRVGAAVMVDVTVGRAVGVRLGGTGAAVCVAGRGVEVGGVAVGVRVGMPG